MCLRGSKLHNFKIVSNPPSTESGYIYVSVNDSLILELSIERGSYIMYTVSWGDSYSDKIDLSQKEKVEARKLSHLYADIGEFILIGAVSNNNFRLSESYTVIVTNCTIPTITLSGGNIRDEAIEISSHSKYELKASYQFKSRECNRTVTPNLFGVWRILNDSTGALIEEQAVENTNILLVFNNRLAYKPGMYSVSLTLIWMRSRTKNISLSYNSFFKVFTSPLLALISGGFVQEIAFKRDIDGNNSTYYGFTVDGSESNDPDERIKGYKMLSFKWSCRILSDIKLIGESRHARMLQNETFKEVCQEFSKYVILKEGLPILKLNTANFLENVTYDFKLEVRKDDRIAHAHQSLKLIPGNPPTMQIQ